MAGAGITCCATAIRFLVLRATWRTSCGCGNVSGQLEAYAKARKDEFLILDALPREWRALVHEFGGNATVRLFRAGFDHADAEAMLAAQRSAAGA